MATGDPNEQVPAPRDSSERTPAQSGGPGGQESGGEHVSVQPEEPGTPAVAPSGDPVDAKPRSAATGAGGAPTGGFTTRQLIVPTTDSGWVQPKFAFWIVAIVAVVILLILGVSLWELSGVSSADGKSKLADPDAGTIAALASAAFAALSSLTAAYFGIKVASEHSAQATEQAARTTTLALQVANNANSSPPGNPTFE
jgi:hypothetical protein